ncbi:hypothetical protein B0J15DRAFT_467760 [Fusarium solani]|uniref:Uncharacterized protein n=1 Tax=Fusarium solani TaxID=169388 RepID=A0A9P9K4N3_FUSSL|nr:uncharacterized protein B0J15DRAFT_467760 [Fusarium solani]KAH7249207.1 hypothetical protein B0J15DRAFT_467760 [Fusarium solani]
MMRAWYLSLGVCLVPGCLFRPHKTPRRTSSTVIRHPTQSPKRCNTALDNRQLANVTAACLGQCHFGRDPCLCRSAGGLTGGAANRERSTADDDSLGFNLRISASGRDSWFVASHSDDEDKAGSGLTSRETARGRNATLTGYDTQRLAETGEIQEIRPLGEELSWTLGHMNPTNAQGSIEFFESCIHALHPFLPQSRSRKAGRSSLAAQIEALGRQR